MNLLNFAILMKLWIHMDTRVSSAPKASAVPDLVPKKSFLARHRVRKTATCLYNIIKSLKVGSGCGSVGRAVASDTRDPRLESRHWQTLIKHLFTVNCVEKTKTKKKEAGNGPFKKVCK